MNQPVQVPVPEAARAVLAGADYADAYEALMPGTLTAVQAARRFVQGAPNWVWPLLALRDLIVKPFGLVSSRQTRAGAHGKIGFFPVLTASDNQAILGLDDGHLDFRLVVDVTPAAPDQTRVVVSTVLRRHNLLGRVYLAAIMPFHRRIVPAYLRGGQRLSA